MFSPAAAKDHSKSSQIKDGYLSQ